METTTSTTTTNSFLFSCPSHFDARETISFSRMAAECSSGIEFRSPEACLTRSDSVVIALTGESSIGIEFQLLSIYSIMMVDFFISFILKKKKRKYKLKFKLKEIWRLGIEWQRVGLGLKRRRRRRRFQPMKLKFRWWIKKNWKESDIETEISFIGRRKLAKLSDNKKRKKKERKKLFIVLQRQRRWLIQLKLNRVSIDFIDGKLRA